MRKEYRAKQLLCIIALCFFFIGVSDLGFAASSKKPIKIGMTTDYSGHTVQYGVKETPAYKMALEEVNKKGGINGRPVELIILDNGGDTGRMLNNLRLLKTKEKCVAMLTGVSSSVNIVAKKWADENHIPVMSPDPMSDKLWQREGKAWWFRTQAVDSLFSKRACEMLKKLGHNKIGYAGTTLAWGPGVLDSMKRYAPQNGIEIKETVWIERGCKDATIQAKQLRDAGVKAVVIADYEVGVWARGLKTLGWSPYMFSHGGSMVPNAMQKYNPQLLEGWECFLTFDKTKPLLQEVWDRYEKFSGKRYADEVPPRTYDAIRLLFEAIRLSGDPDNPEAIRDGFYKIKNFPIATGRSDTFGSFEIGRNHHMTEDNYILYVAKQGKMELVKGR
jgi:branched-chain amino acid transport system substrate-binding protein